MEAMFVIGTAGHVDHGKSTLVEALTGIDPDRLREEKARGMTIDLGFAWLKLPSGRSVSIVDVPGHERFIKNMLAGSGGVDLALLVVAADDGVMPQTREHLAILNLLGVTRGVVAVTKRDLVDGDWITLVRADIEELLRGTTLDGSPVVFCSSRTGAGLDELVRTIDAAIDTMPPKRDDGRPRLPIDRVFTIGGFGTVVTGTLVDGSFRVGDEVEAVPGGARGRIRGLQSHKDSVDRALPGTRTAVNVAGIDREQLRRGVVLAYPGTLTPVRAIDVRLRALAPLRHNIHLTFHSGADEATAQLRLLEREVVSAGDETWAQLRLATPVAVVRGDRFVLRTPSDTVGGGVIADLAPKRHRRRDPATLQALEALLADRPEERVLATVQRHQLIRGKRLIAEFEKVLPDATAIIAGLVTSGALRELGAGDVRLATTAFVEERRRQAHQLISRYHVEHPLRSGLPLEDLRVRMGLDAGELEALLDGDPAVRLSGALAALTAFEVRLTAAQQALVDGYLAGLRTSPERPPSATIDPDLLAYLVSTRAVVAAGDGVIFAADAFDAMRDRIEAHIHDHGSISLAEARDLLGSSRRYVQSLLEHLDRLRITRRVGERRVLR
jgi:selenocysteine-specific elongation factor